MFCASTVQSEIRFRFSCATAHVRCIFAQIGFEMIDAISEAEGIPLRTIQHKALLGKGTKNSSEPFSCF